MKYCALVACYGFQGKYWEMGEVVELSPGEKPPEHFAPIGGEVKPAESEVEGNSQDEAAMQAAEMPIPEAKAEKPAAKGKASKQSKEQR